MSGADPDDYLIRLEAWLTARRQHAGPGGTTLVAAEPYDRTSSAYTIAESDIAAVLDEVKRRRADDEWFRRSRDDWRERSIKLAERCEELRDQRDTARAEVARAWEDLTGVREERDRLAAENVRLRADGAALLDGNQRLQTMNEGLRQMAIQAREAAEGWHQATIDLYSDRTEPHPADCPCGQQPERDGGA